MDRLSFLADEHVPRVFTHAVRSNGFDVTTVRELYGERSVDGTILADSAAEDLVVVTNDRDFVRMADDVDHAGIVVYTDRTLLLDAPTTAAEGISAIDRYYSPAEMRNVVEWLDNWT